MQSKIRDTEISPCPSAQNSRQSRPGIVRGLEFPLARLVAKK